MLCLQNVKQLSGIARPGLLKRTTSYLYPSVYIYVYQLYTYIQGDTPLMKLPGAVWDEFWVHRCAHLALLGVVKGLDELLQRESKEKSGSWK
jgi:hypothetical protein